MSRVSWTIFVFFLLTASVRSQPSGPNLSPQTLNLFMTAEEQQLLDSQRSAVAPTVTPVLPVDNTVSASVKSSDDALDSHRGVESSVRYGGVVMKNGRMLSIWLDGARLSSLDHYKNTVVSDVGVLSISTSGESVQLLPGESRLSGAPMETMPIRIEDIFPVENPESSTTQAVVGVVEQQSAK